jgi:membrane protein required for colicin V production
VSLGALDIVLLGVLLVSGLLGLWRGFIVEVMSLASWLLAFWAAFAFGDALSAALAAWIDSEAVRGAAGYVGVFIATLVAGGLVTWLLARIVRGTGLSGTDRTLGFLFGLVRGIAVCSIGVLLLGLTPLPQSPAWAQSSLVGLLQPGAEWLRSWLPPALAERIRLVPALPVLPPAAAAS